MTRSLTNQVTRYLDDAEFQQTAAEVLAREVYEAVGEPAADSSTM